MDLIKRSKNFRLLLAGSSVSSIGDYLYDIAITLLIYDISKSIDAIAFMWISKAALRIFILYVGGQITDRFDRKRIITLINLISAPIALMFTLVDKNTLWIAYLGVFLLQSLNDIDMCSENAILPELVQKEDIPKANTIFSFINQILMLSALALSGFIYKLVGADVLFVINACSFLIAGLFFQFIQYKTSKPAANSTIKFFDAKVFEVFKDNNILILILVSSAMISIIGRIYDVTNIAIADSKLNITSTGIIYFRYAMAIGGFLTPLILKLKISKKSFNSYIMFSMILVLSVVGFALSGNIYIALIVLVVFGFSSSLQGIYFRSLIQESISSEYMGRVFSFYRIVFTAVSLITVALIPVLSKLIGMEGLYVYSGIPIVIFFIFMVIKQRNIANQKNVLFEVNK